MALCCARRGGLELSEEELALNAAIEAELAAAAEKEAPIIKLLLLGSGACGKSTIFKQLNSLYGKGFTKEQLGRFKKLIRANIMQSMQILVSNANKYKPKGEEKGAGSYEDIPDEAMRMFNISEEEAADEAFGQLLDVEVGHLISQLWQMPLIQLTYTHADTLQLTDSTKYFFDNIDRISSADYFPTIADALRARAPTTGVVEQRFQLDGHEFVMFDVGGQRNERKKWIHCFENVTAIIFVASLAEYNQVLYEDATVNRLDESISLFEEISNNQFLSKTNIVLFLNKKDIFHDKFNKFPLSESHPGFTGSTEEEGIEYIKNQFLGKSTSKNSSRNIYPHVTCATDENNVRNVFNAVKSIILKANTAHGAVE